jgi:hypothetical protein
MRRSVLAEILFVLPLVSAGPAAAQERDRDDEPPPPASTIPEAGDEDEAERAKPASAIVVTARRLDAARTRIDEGLGATVYSLNNETIENRPGGETGSIAAILGQVPGTGLSGRALTIRGSRAIQVRINDIILPEAILDPADHLSSRLAETTRLITGTLPAQFGFAPGGVISVTTKNGLYQSGGQAELFAGSRGMIEPALEWAGSAAGTSLFGSVSFERSRGRVADVLGNSARDRRRELEGLAFADHVIGPNDRLSLIVGGSRERHAIDATSLPAGVNENEDAYAVGAYQHSAGPLSVHAALSMARATDRADFGTPDREHRSSGGAQLDSTYEIGGGHRLGAGLLLSTATSRATHRPAQRRTSFGIYAQDQWTVAPALTLNAGARADWLRGVRSGARLEPRANLVWQAPNGFSAHAGYSRFAAAASLDEDRGTALPIERDDYFDAGGQQKAGPWTFGIDGYWRSARNFIAERESPGTATPAAFVFARGRLGGVELSATYAKGPVTAWANVAISKSRARTIVAGQALFPSETLAAAAAHWVPLASDRPVTATGGITRRMGKLSLSADMTAGSGTVRTLSSAGPNGSRASAFATFGFAVVYHARLAGHALDLRADLTNLTDARYATSDAANLEGGWTRFGEGRAILIGIEQGF